MYIYVYIYYIYIYMYIVKIGRVGGDRPKMKYRWEKKHYRVAKTHRIPYPVGHFSQKSQ